MSQALNGSRVPDLVAEAAQACGLSADDVHVLSANPVTPRDRHDVAAALKGLVGRPCSVHLREIVELEVRGAVRRVALTDDAVGDVVRVLRSANSATTPS
jgi:hypothetical protein